MRALVHRLAKQCISQVQIKSVAMAQVRQTASSDLPPANQKIDPAAKGKRQSPIDIITGNAKTQPFATLNVAYDPSNVKGVTNGGTSVTFSAAGGGSVMGGPLKSKYTLEQFHFHWGSVSSRGSEHLIDGKSFAAELHLVHWNSERYGSFAESLEHPDGLCVLGAFLQSSDAENANYKKLIDEIKRVPFKGETQDISKGFDPRVLLPEDIQSFYHYGGSLTTPPYSECVQWIVFKNPVGLSEAQLQAFRELHVGSEGSACICDNYRAPQDLCSRDVYSC